MPPNSGSGSILDQFECRYKQAANPYSETKHACFEECPGSSGGPPRAREHEAPELAVDDTVRVTTRARQTYELYNYSKNAMLIVTSAVNNYERNAEIMELKTTFAKFRFEVEVVNIRKNNVELYEKCGQFFQRDFTDYGAVALAIVMPMIADDIDGFEESVIMDNFKLERNPTLADKPKIYITEVGRRFQTSVYDHFDALEHATHGDMIGLHCGAIDACLIRLIREKQLSPKAEFNGALVTFCKNLAAMGDNVALPEIISQTKKDNDKNFSLMYAIPIFEDIKFASPLGSIGVVNTLSKELYFARVEET